MRSLLHAATFLLFLIGSASALAADAPSVASVAALLEAGQEPVRIVCLGDSLTGVYYHSGGRRAWPDMLAIALKKVYPNAKIEMFNAGISGQPSGDGLARIDRDVIKRKPNLVIVFLGANDIPGGNREGFRNNMRAIVERCRQANAAVILSTIIAFSPNERRPASAVAEYSQIIRDVAKEFSVPVADLLPVFKTVQDQDPIYWAILMSDELHPTIDGHKLMAETVAQAITGKSVSLADVPPLADSLKITLTRLKAGEPIRIVAMPPYDAMIRDALIQLFPDAKLDVTTWPVEGQSLAAMLEWAKAIRPLKPHLVIPAVPANVEAPDDESLIRDYQLLLSQSIAYECDLWDLLPVMPGVTKPLTAGDRHRAELARRIIAGRDVQWIDRDDGDNRPADQIFSEWIQNQVKSQ